MNMPGIYLAVGILAITLLIVAGRALFMFWFGTAEIIQQNKEIIRLLTIIADNNNRNVSRPTITRTTDQVSAVQSGQSTHPLR